MSKERHAVLAVFVNFFKADRMALAIDSLLSQNFDVDIQVVVIDNSCDQVQRQKIELIRGTHPDISLLFSKENVGYAKGVNAAVALGGEDRHILLVSPDVISESATLGSMLKLFEQNPALGVLAPAQINDDGTKVEVARFFPTLWEQVMRRIGGYKCEGGSNIALDSGFVSVDWLQSSFMIIRRETWNKIQGLSESYFLFMSDTEFCLEVRQAGWRVGYLPALNGLRADGIRASAGGPLKALFSKSIRIHVVDAMKYYFKNGFGSRHTTGPENDRK